MQQLEFIEQQAIVLPPFTYDEFTIRIVTAYEDFAAGLRAREMTERLAAELQCEPGSDVWKFDFLTVPRLRSCAVADAARADLVMISARGDGELPPHVKCWVEEWLRQCIGGPMSLLALLDAGPAAPGLAPAPFTYLCQIAAQGRLNFFCKAGDWQRERFERTVDTLPREARNRKAGVEGILRRELARCSPRTQKSEFPARPRSGRFHYGGSSGGRQRIDRPLQSAFPNTERG